MAGGELDLALDWNLSDSFRLYLHGSLVAESREVDKVTGGFVEGYLEWRRDETASGTWQIRLGPQILPTSRENTDPLWVSPYTLTGSAINGWIAEEVRPTALDLEWRWQSTGGHGFRLGAGLLSLAPVALGSLWTLGCWGWLDGRLDLFSLSVLPILLGIGVDDGLHAVHGARVVPGVREGMLASVKKISRAVTLTTMTTAVGFGSLTLSSVPGLRRGGLLVAVGVVLCLAATLFVLPALDLACSVLSVVG